MKRCEALAERGYCERPLPCPIHNRRIHDCHQAGMLTEEQAIRLCGSSEKESTADG